MSAHPRVGPRVSAPGLPVVAPAVIADPPLQFPHRRLVLQATEERMIEHRRRPAIHAGKRTYGGRRAGEAAHSTSASCGPLRRPRVRRRRAWTPGPPYPRVSSRRRAVSSCWKPAAARPLQGGPGSRLRRSCCSTREPGLPAARRRERRRPQPRASLRQPQEQQCKQRKLHGRLPRTAQGIAREKPHPQVRHRHRHRHMGGVSAGARALKPPELDGQPVALRRRRPRLRLHPAQRLRLFRKRRP